MLLERISDGAFVTANKLNFLLYKLRIICELFNKPTKSEVKVKIQKLKVKNQKSKVKSKVRNQKSKRENKKFEIKI